MGGVDRSISDDLWRKHFATRAGSYDGGRFEELSLELLRAMFGGEWRRTKQSFDGNKDFVLEFRSQTIWAESKAYARTLTYHIISPTLFMALIGDPESIVFISRSPIHSRSKCYLAQFQRRTGKHIVTLDGDALDRSILRHAKVSQRFFPDEVLRPLSNEALRVYVDPTPDVTARPGNRALDAHSDEERATIGLEPEEGATVGIGEYLRIDIAVASESTTSTKVIRAWLVPSEKDRAQHFAIAGFCEEEQHETITFDLGPGEIRHLTAFVRATAPGKHIPLPVFCLETRDGLIRKELGHATISQLYRIGLVGRVTRQIIEECRNAARMRRRAWVLQIEGGSGLGKTRLLKEIEGEFAANGYIVHTLDKEFYEPQRSEEVIRGLLAQLNNLPLIDEALSDATRASNDEIDQDLLTRLIFSPHCPERQDPSKVGEAILQSIAHRKTALIIDNVQNFDDLAASTLDATISRLMQDSAPREFAIVLAFNTDLCVEGSEANALRQRLATAATDSAALGLVYWRELATFDDDEVDQFLLAAVASGDSKALNLADYPRTVLAFRTHVPRNPLHMWETLRWLRDANVLYLKNELLVIADKDDTAIAALLAEIPRDLETLMSRRWRQICESCDRGHQRSARAPSGRSIMHAALAAYSLGLCNRRQLGKVGADASAVDRLIEVGVLVDSGHGEVRFVHQRIFKFFQHVFAAPALAEARAVLAGLQELNLPENRFEQFFIFSEHAEAVDARLLQRTCELFLERGASHEYVDPFLSLLIAHLSTDTYRTDDMSLNVFMKACGVIQSLRSMRAGFEAINRAFFEKVSGIAGPGPSAQALFEFDRCHINAALSVGEDTLARSLVENSIRRVAAGSFGTAESAGLARAALLDRKSAILKSYGAFEEALDTGREALVIARAQGDRWLEIELLSNLAEVHFRILKRDSIEAGRELLISAISLFDESTERWNFSDPVPVRSFVNRARLYLRDGAWHALTREAERGLQYADSVRNRFWASRLALLAAAGWLIACSHEETTTDVVHKAIRRAQDAMNVYGARRDAWAVPYLSGKAALLGGDSRRADENFRMAIQMLCARDPEGRVLFQRLDLALDIAVSARTAGLPVLKGLPSLLNNPYVAAECTTIAGMSEHAFIAFRSSWYGTAYSATMIEPLPLTIVAL